MDSFSRLLDSRPNRLSYYYSRERISDLRILGRGDARALGGTSVVGGSVPRLMGIDVNTDPSPRCTDEGEFPTEGMQVFFGNRDYDISADGERFIVIFPGGEVVSRAPPRPATNVFQNWFTELLERVPVE